jgi:uncharacterized protein (DUF362 family)
MDGEHFGLPCWNPLGEIIRPGQTVVLKPNFVHELRETRAGHGDCLITHGSVIRAVVDYVYIALKGQGRIVIADAPQNDADFEAILAIAGLQAVCELYGRHAGFNIEVLDLRQERVNNVDGVSVGQVALPGDPGGYVRVDLGAMSEFASVNHLRGRLYGSEYDSTELRSHHHGPVHEYLISKTVLDADCVISIPKLKTHKKTGLTASMKNLVGINGNKNWLPHHREGTPAQGGDEFADNAVVHRIERRVMRSFKWLFPRLGFLRRFLAGPLKATGRKFFGDTNVDTIRSGNWHGNDTTWRMVIDLNRALMYADSSGVVHDRPQRQVLAVVDGIISGEGNGPLDATPKNLGVILAGRNAVAVDATCARLMGFDYRRLPGLCRVFREHPLPLVAFGAEDLSGKSGDPKFNCGIASIVGTCFAFEPPFGWRGHIEVRD